MISDDELDEIQARANAATEGPWRASWDEADRWFSITGQPNPSRGDDRMVCPEVATLNHQPWWTADAVFIAHARTDVPRLIAEIRQAKAEALREAATAYQWGGWARKPQARGDLEAKRLQAEHAVAWLRDRADGITEARDE